METKLQALELIEKFKPYAKDEYFFKDDAAAKCCALFHLEETIKQLKSVMQTSCQFDAVLTYRRLLHYEKLKEEIEKMLPPERRHF